MATVDEIFDTMPLDTTEYVVDNYLIIDAETREITVPDNEMVFGVESDGKAERKYFQCPRYVGQGIDLASCFIRINYRNANGDIDAYLVNDVAIKGDYITFSWELARKVTVYHGIVNFVVCAGYHDREGNITNEWNTTVAVGTVLEGIEPEVENLEGTTSELVTQLLSTVAYQTRAVESVGTAQIALVTDEGNTQVANVKTASNEAQNEVIAQIESKGVETLATIPADYTVISEKVNKFSNALTGEIEGAVIRVDDVSPVEHYPTVKVHGKNLIPYPYKQTTATLDGGTFTSQSDGGVFCEGVPTNYVSLNLYEGEPLVKEGSFVYSASGDFENVSIALVIYDKNENILFSKETWANAAPIVTNASLYPTATRWLAYIKRGTPNIAISGVLYPKLEIGTTATAYSPYVDPTTVRVRRCGKNLFDIGVIEDYHHVGGNNVTITNNRINGVVMENNSSYCINLKHKLPKGNIGISFAYSGTTPRALIRPCDSDGNTITVCPELTNKGFSYNASYDAFYGNTSEIAMLIPDYVAYWHLGFVFPKSATDAVGTTVTVSNVMVEYGDRVTAYAAPEIVEYIPRENGSVEGVTSVAPHMTLLTDTEKVTIQCEYNRDINKVIADILTKIGG